MIHEKIPTSSIVSLLKQAELCSTIDTIIPCLGGNNRTYRTITKDGSFLVKQYFRQAGDDRDRLTAEFAFLSYAKEVAPHFVPTPYIKDSANAMAIYEFIEGKPIHLHDMLETDVAEAIKFFCALNNSAAKAKANGLALASEACFTLQAHLDLIETRLSALQHIRPQSEEDRFAKKLIGHLYSVWHEVMSEIKQWGDQHNQLNTTLPLSQRCISPSDFGFHNTLRLADGSIRFLDFEYAGWDDPAKMVGDFFSQLAVPIPTKFFHFFTQQVMQPFPNSQDLIQRATLLRKVYQVKWCCIVLNIFLPIHLERRQFANPKLNVTELKKTQLIKATSLLKLLEHQHDLY